MADSNRTERRLLDSIRQAKAGGEDAPQTAAATADANAGVAAPRPAATKPRAGRVPARAGIRTSTAARTTRRDTASSADAGSAGPGRSSAGQGVADYQRFPRIWPD